jgi:hypothetical protein
MIDNTRPLDPGAETPPRPIKRIMHRRFCLFCGMSTGLRSMQQRNIERFCVGGFAWLRRRQRDNTSKTRAESPTLIVPRRLARRINGPAT